MTLGKRISTLRRDKKLSQEYVAEALNVSRQAVSKWENDLSIPDMENLIALAGLLEVDVEFLATGQIGEDLVSEPLPEPPELPKPEKSISDHKRLLCVLLSVSILLNILFIGLWRYERCTEERMEEYCAACVGNAANHFADFVHTGSDGSYYMGVAAFHSFMTSCKWLREAESGSSYNYQQCHILLTSLIYNRERCENYMEQIRRVLRLLKEDKDDFNAYHELSVLNNEIRYGE
ncbi:MAG: helix-turn-helix transcriptional regulator [Ruminococcaceae bacterium]|nr:helix-turn-helix transcriptional regulator [Oscillospiraceae bacterium]